MHLFETSFQNEITISFLYAFSFLSRPLKVYLKTEN